MVRPQHGRPPAPYDMGRGGAERAARTSQRRSHRAGALIYPAGEFGVDRGAPGFRLSDRLPRRQRLLRGDVRRRADGGIHRVFGRPHLPVRGDAGAAMAGVTDAMRRRGRSAAGLAPIVVLLAAWEIFARSGAVTPFMLPAPSAVAGRILDDAGLTTDCREMIARASTVWEAATALYSCLLDGEIFINIGVTLWRTLAGFII